MLMNYSKKKRKEDLVSVGIMNVSRCNSLMSSIMPDDH